MIALLKLDVSTGRTLDVDLLYRFLAINNPGHELPSKVDKMEFFNFDHSFLQYELSLLDIEREEEVKSMANEEN